MESVESPGHLHKGAAFILEDLPHCPICDLRMSVDLGIGNTLVEEPAVQLIQALHTEPRREEALTDKTDLVLDLALFPARCRRARRRLDKIMAAHLQEATVIGAILAEEDRLHRRLHVVVDAAGAGALEEGKRAIVRVEHHLLRLARIRPSKHHPAVAEPNVRNLHRHRRAVDQHDFVVPVELVSFSRCKRQRHISFRRDRAAILLPRLGIAPDRVVTAVVAKRPQLFKYPDLCQAFAGNFAVIRQQ
jgi:hypothetical protein